MNDYEVAPRPKSRNALTKIPGTSTQLVKDIHGAIAAGVSYGVYMGMKQDKLEEAYYKKYGKRRR